MPTNIDPHTKTKEIGEPSWATRSHRALDKIDAPRLNELPADVVDAVMGNRRTLAVTLIARPVVAAVVWFAAAFAGWWVVALPLTALVYGGSLTAVHHLIHGSLGLSPRARRFWLRWLGCLVAESGHALQVTHLAHHRAGADRPDPEGYIENVTWAQMPLAALRFRYRLAFWGLRHSPRPHRIRVELAVHAFLHLASLALWPITPVLWIYMSAIHVASFAFAVLAGKGPQTNWGRAITSPLVRVHTRLGRILFFSHDQHLEHHAYPKVPLPRLHRLHPVLEDVWADQHVHDVHMAV